MVQTFVVLFVFAADFERDVYPVFEKHCFGCHNAGTKMGSLDLETFDGLLRGGNNGTILVPGKSTESRLYTMLTGEQTPAMPMDGKLLPAAEVAKVKAWIDAGAKAPPELKYSIAWKDGRIATGGLRTVTLWREDGKTKIATFAGHAGAVRAVAFAPDRPLLASGDEKGQVKVWDLNTASLLTSISTGDQPVQSLAFSPDGKRIAVIRRDGSLAFYFLRD